LILATLRANWTIVLADAVAYEVERAIANRLQSQSEGSQAVAAAYKGWLMRVRHERHALPTETEERAYFSSIMPVLRRRNDLDAVITAIKAKPNWVLSTNTAHWSPALAARTGLRTATPGDFLQQLVPPLGR
jgi:hypothetical protein